MNFSTRPFYNERGVYFVLGILGVVAILLFTFSVGRFSRLFQEESSLNEAVAMNQSEIDRLTVELQMFETDYFGELRESETDVIRMVNELLKRRAFSWTLFLNRIEEALPTEVTLTAIRPDFSNGRVEVELAVVADSVGVLDRFIGALEESGGFEDMLSRQEEMIEDGVHRAVLYGRYSSFPSEVVQASDRTIPERFQ